jgi:hypothetical protein
MQEAWVPFNRQVRPVPVQVVTFKSGRVHQPSCHVKPFAVQVPCAV